MTMEIEKLVANSKHPEALARVFNYAAERLADPLEFKRDDEPPEEEGLTDDD